MEDLINARCGWAGTDELYIKYHDEEWGNLVTDDKTLFEFLVLESAQAGLSWITILRKREGYREAFHHFDVQKVAQMTSEDIERLMKFDGIVKNRLKINSTINNAKLFMAIQQEFGSFYEYILSFFPQQPPMLNNFKTLSQIPASRVGCYEQGHEKARLQVLWLHYLLCFFAGGRLCERPFGRLFL